MDSVTSGVRSGACAVLCGAALRGTVTRVLLMSVCMRTTRLDAMRRGARLRAIDRCGGCCCAGRNAPPLATSRPFRPSDRPTGTLLYSVARCLPAASRPGVCETTVVRRWLPQLQTVDVTAVAAAVATAAAARALQKERAQSPL